MPTSNGAVMRTNRVKYRDPEPAQWKELMIHLPELSRKC